jgi:hypothetical protein
MPLPATIRLAGNQAGKILVYVKGPQSSFTFKLPAKPESIELDPDNWIFSEKTGTKKK